MSGTNGHKTRISDASSFDEICDNCGATDRSGDNGLNEPCPYPGGKPANHANVGRKDDQGKDRWDLVPWAAVTQVVKVLTFGANHYGDDNWRRVEGWRKRYFAAACRHLTRWVLGERTDPATGLHHLAHAACCVLFLLELDV